MGIDIIRPTDKSKLEYVVIFFGLIIMIVLQNGRNQQYEMNGYKREENS